MARKTSHAQERYTGTAHKMAQRTCQRMRLPQAPGIYPEVFVGFYFS
jgi:hypothetical protein